MTEHPLTIPSSIRPLHGSVRPVSSSIRPTQTLSDLTVAEYNTEQNDEEHNQVNQHI